MRRFAELNINDPIFNSLKTDYPGTENSTGFIEWFQKKSVNESTALVFEDEFGLGAFIALKAEEEEITLQNKILPANKRIKVSTFCIAERYRRLRIGEGAIGLLLWKWQKTDAKEIYVTVFEKQRTLINQFEKFGFIKEGTNLNGEFVYMKNRNQIDFSNPFKSFPYIKSDFDYAGYVIIDDIYHDTMFAYSELANTASLQAKISSSVSNGLSKIYVGQAVGSNHTIGEPVLIYRRYTQGDGKRYRSCVTSFCVVTDIIQAKINKQYLMTFEELKKRVGNKSVFDEKELQDKYINFKNMIVMELLYYGYFGAGNNVNMDWLEKKGFWGRQGQYPTAVKLTVDGFKKILMEGNVNVSNVIID